jgi:hypothetical protein
MHYAACLVAAKSYMHAAAIHSAKRMDINQAFNYPALQSAIIGSQS